MAMSNPPHSHFGDRVPKSRFLTGEPLSVLVTTVRCVPCLVVISQQVPSFHDSERRKLIVWFDYRTTSGFAKAGTHEADYHNIKPDNPPSDHYFYQDMTIFDCDHHRLTARQVLPPSPFEIAS
jgi:hypothetical protein